MERETEFIYESHENIVREDTGFPALAITGTREDTGKRIRIILERLQFTLLSKS